MSHKVDNMLSNEFRKDQTVKGLKSEKKSFKFIKYQTVKGLRSEKSIEFRKDQTEKGLKSFSNVQSG